MNFRRIGVLLRNEIMTGTRNYIFVVAIVAPVLISLVISLVFGSWFTDLPKLGYYDRGDSLLPALSVEQTALVTKNYETEADLRLATEIGAVDMGLVLPAGFDTQVKQGDTAEITVYVWGESLAKHRITTLVAITEMLREITGQEIPLEMQTVLLGDQANVPWGDRLLPFIVLMAVFFGGMMLPAVAVISEKQKRTLQALTVTPTSIGEIFSAKAVMGIVLSLVMGIVILLMNQAFGARPGLLIMVMALGAVMAVLIGLICGTLVKDVTTLFTIWKSGGILIFAPAILFVFPQAPNWIGYLFPTHYILQPVVEISQHGGGWTEIALEVLILIGLDVLFLGLLVFTARRKVQFL